MESFNKMFFAIFFSKIMICVTILIILFKGNPDLMDAIIKRLGGY